LSTPYKIGATFVAGMEHVATPHVSVNFAFVFFVASSKFTEPALTSKALKP
jgi:hypothetical protein